LSGETEEVKLLREILKYTKFAGMAQVKGVLETVLNTPKKRLGYQLSDGTRGTREVTQQSGLADVSDSWKEWKRKGIGETISVQRGERFKRAFDLLDFGIEVPPVLQAPTVQTPTVEVPATTTPVEKPESGQTELIGT
jgi:hypothetical protein